MKGNVEQVQTDAFINKGIFKSPIGLNWLVFLLVETGAWKRASVSETGAIKNADA